MEPALVATVDGLRALAAVAAEAIVANAEGGSSSGGGGGGDRALVALASDTELACASLLGTRERPTAPAGGPSKKASFLNLGGLLGRKDAAAAAGGGEAAAAAVGDAAAAAAAATAASTADELRPELSRALSSPQWCDAQRRAQLAPVTDIVCVLAGESLPAGFVRLTTSVTGAFAADLNAGSGARQAWLAVARFPSAPPITSLAVVVLELGEFTPPGFQPVRHPLSGKPANMRLGASPPSEVYLCYSRAPGAPITDVGLAFPYGASRAPALRLLPSASAMPAGDGERRAPPVPARAFHPTR